MHHLITLQQAKDMVQRYRREKKSILSGNYRGKEILVDCETFPREAIEKILNQSSCAYLRAYYGMNVNNALHLVLVGADKDGNDLLPDGEQASEEEPPIVDEGQACPPNCPPVSPLYP